MVLTNTNNQIKKTTTISAIAAIIIPIFISIIASLSIYPAYGSGSDVGFQDGLRDCSSGTSDAINGHSNAGHHSAAYMKAYNQGLTSCNNSDSNNDASPQQNQSSNSGGNALCSLVLGTAGKVIGHSILPGPGGIIGGSVGASLC